MRLFTAALAIALGYQAYRILPVTPLVPVQAVPAQGCAQESRTRLLIVNVLQSNRRAGPLLDILRQIDPDMLLAVETDAWWNRVLSVLEPEYPFSVRQPQDDTYGMHLFSKLELLDPQVRFLLDEHVPSIKSGVRLRSGAVLDFYGVHPKPPTPGQDTAQRDAELVIVGREVRAGGKAAIVAGDLNDVAWSQTNDLFQSISGLLDPRIGRGLFATFNANWPLLRWPLDHVYFEESLTVLGMERLGDIGSDHFPVYVALCHAPEAAAKQDAPDAGPREREQASEAIRKGREETP